MQIPEATTTSFDKWLEAGAPQDRAEALALRDALDEADIPNEHYDHARGGPGEGGWTELVIWRSRADLGLRLTSRLAWTTFSEMVDRLFKPKDQEWEEVREDFRIRNRRERP